LAFEHWMYRARVDGKSDDRSKGFHKAQRLERGGYVTRCGKGGPFWRHMIGKKSDYLPSLFCDRCEGRSHDK
jgi:hypothetical protein